MTTFSSISLTWTVDDRKLVHVEEDVAEIFCRNFSLKKSRQICNTILICYSKLTRAAITFSYFKNVREIKKKHEFYTYILRYERKSSDQTHSNHIFFTYTFFDSVV